jgi:chaperonin cofactor prefoldin
MGYAKILENKGDGQYLIELDFGQEEAEKQKEETESRINALNTDIEKLEKDFKEYQKTYDDLLRDANQAIIDKDKEKIEQYYTAFYTFRFRLYDKAKNVIRDKKALRAELQLKKFRLERITVKREIESYAVDGKSDYTVGSTVLTLEVPGEPQIDKLVDPKALGNVEKIPVDEDGNPIKSQKEEEEERLRIFIAPYNPSAPFGLGVLAEGVETQMAGKQSRLFNRELIPSYLAYLCAALLPGWQKFMPTYRTGTIVDKKSKERNDLTLGFLDYTPSYDIELDPENSSAQYLDVSIAKDFFDVIPDEVVADKNAYDVGDKAVVGFAAQKPAEPRIVGFSKNGRLFNEYVTICEVMSGGYLDHRQFFDVFGYQNFNNSLPAFPRRFLENVFSGSASLRGRYYLSGFSQQIFDFPDSGGIYPADFVSTSVASEYVSIQKDEPNRAFPPNADTIEIQINNASGVYIDEKMFPPPRFEDAVEIFPEFQKIYEKRNPFWIDINPERFGGWFAGANYSFDLEKQTFIRNSGISLSMSLPDFVRFKRKSNNQIVFFDKQTERKPEYLMWVAANPFESLPAYSVLFEFFKINYYKLRNE